MPGLVTDARLIGAVSAQAVTAGQVAKGKHEKPRGGRHRKGRVPAPAPVQTGSWKPGDTAEAGRVLTALGLTPDEQAIADQAAAAAASVARQVRATLGRVLVNGADVAGILVQDMAAAARDKDRAAAAALAQILDHLSASALEWYDLNEVTRVTWLTEDDARVCPTCLMNSGETVTLGQAFRSGDESPPAHPRCRCAIVPARDHEPAPERSAEPEPAEAEEPGAPEEDPVDEADALLAAYEAGYQVIGPLRGGASGASVTKVTLADGTVAAVKKHADPSEALHEYLAGLVGRALGIDGTGTALVDDLTTVAQFAPGITGTEARGAAGENILSRHANELRRLVQLRNGREIGLLDWLTNQVDRNGGNFMVDGDVVRPIDNALADFKVTPGGTGGLDMLSPFSRFWLTDGANITRTDDIDPADLRSPYTADELAGIRRSLEGLRDEFDYRHASRQYEFMMNRLAMLEAIA
jgi:hypothetical protein